MKMDEKCKTSRVQDEIRHDGRVYYPSRYYIKKYDMSHMELTNARNVGKLPHIRVGRYFYYNEKDFNDYYAGKIGVQTEYTRKEDL